MPLALWKRLSAAARPPDARKEALTQERVTQGLQ